VKLVFKSAAFGLLGAALFFAFFSMLSVPVLGAWSRLHNPNTPLEAQDVLIQPINFLRLVGLPLAGGAFVGGFIMGWKKFAHPAAAQVERQP
jgi:hypothetical protein